MLTQEITLGMEDQGLVFWGGMNYSEVKKELISLCGREGQE